MAIARRQQNGFMDTAPDEFGGHIPPPPPKLPEPQTPMIDVQRPGAGPTPSGDVDPAARDRERNKPAPGGGAGSALEPDIRRVGGAQATPSMPSEPIPQASGSPSTFQPIPGKDLSRLMPLGHANGLLGGGIGIAGGGTYEEPTGPDVLQLLKLLGVQ